MHTGAVIAVLVIIVLAVVLYKRSQANKAKDPHQNGTGFPSGTGDREPPSNR